MEIKELADFIIKYTGEVNSGYVTLGMFPDGKYHWCLTKFEHGGYPMTYAEAEQIVEHMKKEYGSDEKDVYEIVPRQKGEVTLTLANDFKPA